MIIFLAFLLFVSCDASQMVQHAFNASDFCAMKVIVRCFTSSKLGLPRQTCGAQNVFELARKGVGNRHRCMQATKITKWLQTTQIDTDALKNEVVSDCGAFQQINTCVDPYKEHCHDVFQVFGLNMFLRQWNYICDPKMYPRLEKHILCKREVPESANDECRQFAPVLGISFDNSTVTSNMTDVDCIKYKLILGCRAKVMLAYCEKGKGILASHFLLDFFNIQSESVGSKCLFGKEIDPVKLASTYEKYITELSSQSGELSEVANSSTTSPTPITTTSTTATTTTTTRSSTMTTRRKLPTTRKFKLPPIYEENIIMPGTNELDDPFLQYDSMLSSIDEENSSSSSFNAGYYSLLLLVSISFVFQ